MELGDEGEWSILNIAWGKGFSGWKLRFSEGAIGIGSRSSRSVILTVE